jgi:protein-S-isoprenylcysteine O-methyltransferase Ste14
MMVGLGSKVFRYRNGLVPLIFMLAILAGRPAYPFGRPDLDTVLDLVGVGLALLGQILRVLTIGYEYIIRGGRNRRVYAENLVQGGVFAHCRNPLYLGKILIALGLAVMINSVVFYLVFIPFTLIAYASIVAAEEEYLRGKFGAEYDEYCRRVNRWWPRWAGFSKSVEGMHFNWRRVVVKEYNSVFALVAGLPIVVLWTNYRVAGADALPPSHYLIASALGLLSLYLFVRALKKTGRLTD